MSTYQLEPRNDRQFVRKIKNLDQYDKKSSKTIYKMRQTLVDSVVYTVVWKRDRQTSANRKVYAGRKGYMWCRAGHGSWVGSEGIWRHGYAVCRRKVSSFEAWKYKKLEGSYFECQILEHTTEIGLRMTARSNNWEELSKASKCIGKYVLVGNIIYRKSKLNEGNKLKFST